MKEGRKGFVFYASFYESAKTLENTEKMKLYDAIIEYGLNQKEPALDGYLKAMFELIRPQMDANFKRYLNGKKGGRPKQE